MDQDTQTEARPEQKTFGPIIGIVIIIVVLVVGALYFWGASLNRGSVQTTVQETNITPDASTQTPTMPDSSTASTSIIQ